MNRRGFLQSMFGLPLALAGGVAAAAAISKPRMRELYEQAYDDFMGSTLNVEKIKHAKLILEAQPIPDDWGGGYVFDSRLGLVTVNEWCRAMIDREIIDALMAS